jgi:hypothetical protein
MTDTVDTIGIVGIQPFSLNRCHAVRTCSAAECEFLALVPRLDTPDGGIRILPRGWGHHLPLDLRQTVKQSSESAPRTLADADREHILETLEQSNWLIGGQDGAASRLGCLELR